MSYDTDALAIFAAFSTPPDTTRKGHINTLVLALKGHSLWTKLDWLAIFAAADSQAALINWKAPGTLNPTAVNSPTFTADEGFAGNGSSSYVATGFIPGTHGSNYLQNSSALSIYIRTSRTSGVASQIIGSRSVASQLNGLVPKWTDNTCYYEATGSASGSVAQSNIQGMWNVSRTGASALELFRNGSSFSTSSAASASLTGSTAVHIGARNGNGTPERFSTDQFSFACLSGGLNATEAANLSADINAYMTALGKNVY